MGEAKASILIVDDEEPIRRIISRNLEAEGYTCVTAADGREALWKASKEDFDVILLDIMMPGLSGMEVLPKIFDYRASVRVIVLTAIKDINTSAEAMRLGAYDYVTKPFEMADLLVRVGSAVETRESLMQNGQHRQPTEQRYEPQVDRRQQCSGEATNAPDAAETAHDRRSESRSNRITRATEREYMHMARALALLTEMREPYARRHSKRVSLLANGIAIHLGCTKELIREIRLASLIHDVGEIVLAEHSLFKQGNLTPSQYREIKKHPIANVEDIVGHLQYSKGVLSLVESQHECYNGSGYPNRLCGEDIPLGSRILAVADAYDSMTCPRPHLPNPCYDEALTTLRQGAGHQWDPKVLEALLQVLEPQSTLLRASLDEIE